VAVPSTPTSTVGGVVALPGVVSIPRSRGPSPGRQSSSGPKLDRTAREIVARLQPRAGGGYHYRDGEFTADIAPDGSVRIEDKHAFSDGPSLSIKADVTDALMRLAGDDPYRAAKARFLDATREVRLGMMKRFHADRLEDSVWDTKDRLKLIWSDGLRSTASRRAEVFQLWDECVESGPDADVRAARAVRATIQGWVRRELPRTHRDAFSEDELAALNRRRRSSQRFDPYVATSTTASP